MTLGDFSTNSKSNGDATWIDGWDPDNDLLYFIDANAKMSEDAYYNVPQWMIDESWGDEYKTGWYILGDGTYALQNNVKVPFGEGIIIQASSANDGKNPALLVNGQVKADLKDIPVAKFIAVGACRPSRIYLGDITTNSESNGDGTWTNGWDPDNDLLYFIDENAKMSEDAYYNVPQWMIDESWGDEYKAGWYILGDGTYALQNHLYVEPGSGFIIQASSAADGKEPAIQIKSALDSTNTKIED